MPAEGGEHHANIDPRYRDSANALATPIADAQQRFARAIDIIKVIQTFCIVEVLILCLTHQGLREATAVFIGRKVSCILYRHFVLLRIQSLCGLIYTIHQLPVLVLQFTEAAFSLLLKSRPISSLEIRDKVVEGSQTVCLLFLFEGLNYKKGRIRVILGESKRKVCTLPKRSWWIGCTREVIFILGYRNS